jgi:RNA polymerase primary sigma factor
MKTAAQRQHSHDIGAKYSYNKDNDPRFMQLIASKPPTHKENADLIRRAKEGNKQAFDEFIKRNARFIFSYAKKNPIPGYEQKDVFQLVVFGLYNALKGYDESTGFTFLSYAVWYMKAEVCKAKKNGVKVVKYSSNVVITANNVLKKYEKESCKNPDLVVNDLVDELEATSGTKAMVSEYLALSCSSYDRKVFETENDSPRVSDLIQSDTNILDEFEKKESLSELEKTLMHLLKPNRYYVLKHYFGLFGCEQKSLFYLSKETGTTTQNISDLVQKSITELRKNKELFRQFADLF